MVKCWNCETEGSVIVAKAALRDGNSAIVCFCKHCDAHIAVPIGGTSTEDELFLKIKRNWERLTMPFCGCDCAED